MSQIVVLSSMESEYNGACELVCIGVWLRRCLEELGCPSCGPTTIGCDNKSAIVFANEAIIQNRSKHIDTRYHFIRERINDKTFSIYHLPTKEMPADALTKPLAVAAFKKCRLMMGVLRVSENRD